MYQKICPKQWADFLLFPSLTRSLYKIWWAIAIVNQSTFFGSIKVVNCTGDNAPTHICIKEE